MTQFVLKPGTTLEVTVDEDGQIKAEVFQDSAVLGPRSHFATLQAAKDTDLIIKRG